MAHPSASSLVCASETSAVSSRQEETSISPVTPMRKERSCPLPSQTRSEGPTVRRLDTRQGFRAPEPTTEETYAAPGPRTMLFAHGDDEGRNQLSPSILIEQAENSLSACTAIEEQGKRSIRRVFPSAVIISPLDTAQARARLCRAPSRLWGLISARICDVRQAFGTKECSLAASGGIEQWNVSGLALRHPKRRTETSTVSPEIASSPAQH
jgi:hypothetical protein